MDAVLQARVQQLWRHAPPLPLARLCLCPYALDFCFLLLLLDYRGLAHARFFLQAFLVLTPHLFLALLFLLALSLLLSTFLALALFLLLTLLLLSRFFLLTLDLRLALCFLGGFLLCACAAFPSARSPLGARRAESEPAWALQVSVQAAEVWARRPRASAAVPVVWVNYGVGFDPNRRQWLGRRQFAP